MTDVSVFRALLVRKDQTTTDWTNVSAWVSRSGNEPNRASDAISFPGKVGRKPLSLLG